MSQPSEGTRAEELTVNDLDDTTEQPDNVLGQQYEYKIRPCIDLIDSLRSLGVEKDLALPVIAVIGDQSSSKRSVLEALSGVNLPRGSDIVTRCPLVLKLKKSKKDLPWKGKISYQDQDVELQNPGEVEKEIRKAQDYMAGAGNGVSQDLITLAIESAKVPDLTLLDLPGITRVALPNQPRDIGERIKKMIREYINRQETINLAVVPSNVDIATTEALKMARVVDPDGERTLAILTKPDLVDKGSELDVVSVVQNQVCTLKKGYMIVKCRGQNEIQNNIFLEDTLLNERAFFENHEHFGALLEEGRATIPLLAEKLTLELVEHIFRSIPALETQLKTRLLEAEKKLKLIGAGVPESESEKLIFLINRIQHFGKGINQVIQGEEEVIGNSQKLFTQIRTNFDKWEKKLQECIYNFRMDLPLYRGREPTGFVNYKTFENIARSQVQTFEEPAIDTLNEISELVRSTFNDITLKHFCHYHNLYSSAKGKLEEICSDQQKEAEKEIHRQFKREQIIYCRDNLYTAPQSYVQRNTSSTFFDQETLKTPKTNVEMSVELMSQHMQEYLKTMTARLSKQIPLIILHCMLHECADKLEAQMLLLLQDKENINMLLVEKEDLVRERQNLNDQIKRLQGAQKRVAKFPYK